MQQPPTPMPLNYASPAPRDRRGGKRWIGWVLFIGLAVLLFLLLGQRGTPAREIQRVPLSELESLLQSNLVRSLVISDDEVRGEYNGPVVLPDGTTVRAFRMSLPEGMGTDWHFVQWVLQNRRGVTVEARRSDGLLMNILLPLVPWLVIFGFIWFFVFRKLGKMGPGAGGPHLTITGPGRWIPNEPAKAGRP